MPSPPPLAFEHTVVITAPPDAVLGAFFDPAALPVWWDTVRSVTTPRPLGVYAVEWRATPFRDELLGTLGGVFYGTVMDFRPGRALSIAGAYWLPPGSLAFGPMALDVRCSVQGPATRLLVRQSGSWEGPHWERYYQLIGTGWRASLDGLKTYLERPPTGDGAAVTAAGGAGGDGAGRAEDDGDGTGGTHRDGRGHGRARRAGKPRRR